MKVESQPAEVPEMMVAATKRRTSIAKSAMGQSARVFKATKYLYQFPPAEVAHGSQNSAGRRYHEYIGRDADLRPSQLFIVFNQCLQSAFGEYMIKDRRGYDARRHESRVSMIRNVEGATRIGTDVSIRA